jgi:hypothetical protein
MHEERSAGRIVQECYTYAEKKIEKSVILSRIFLI